MAGTDEAVDRVLLEHERGPEADVSHQCVGVDQRRVLPCRPRLARAPLTRRWPVAAVRHSLRRAWRRKLGRHD